MTTESLKKNSKEYLAVSSNASVKAVSNNEVKFIKLYYLEKILRPALHVYTRPKLAIYI